MHPLQNRNAEHTFARYCSKSPDYFHRNSVAQLFSGAGFSSPQQARAPDSCVPYSARPGQPCPAGGVAGSGGGRASAWGRGRGVQGGGSSRGRWGRRTHPESLVSARLRRRLRRAGLEVSGGREGMRGSCIQREEGEKRSPCAQCAEGSPAGEQEGARFARGWLLRCFLERRR